MTQKARALVIGLGQIAWRFDEEPGRTSVWTHVGAYKALADRYEIAGAFDADAAARAAFAQRHPDVPVSHSLSALLGSGQADVISICTPAASHRAVLEEALAARPKAVWCEKPLATALAQGQAMVRACDAAGARLIVSHIRRWAPLWRRFKERLESGEIGTPRSLRIAMPNRLWSIGSHAADLLLWLAGDVEEVEPLPFPAMEEEGEPAVGALAAFRSGAAGIVQVTGLKAGLIVEAEAIGDEGRLCVREDRNTICFEPFAASARYQGYLELGEAVTERIDAAPDFSPFVEIAREAADIVEGKRVDVTCDGAAALATQAFLETLAARTLEAPQTGRVSA